MIRADDAVAVRARLSRGTSGDAIYRLVADEMGRRNASGNLFDVGCGTGALRGFLPSSIHGYCGVDVVHYDEFPSDGRFVQASLDAGPWPITDGSADVAVSVETIEHLENPRLFFRELTRITRPGGLVIVTTPNQLSWLSLLTLLLKDQFNGFQEAPGLYPAHITALLPVDLLRIARECRLAAECIRYSDAGRMPGSRRHWPRWLRGKRFSDNVMLAATRPL